MLIAADVLIRTPSHALAWRLLHDGELLAAPAWLSPWLPAGAPFDRDPLALLLAGAATGLAAVYVLASLARAGTRLRGGLVAVGAAVLVLLPSVLHMSVGVVTGRPFGQDGGVVQLPLALDRILAGQTPYGADYSDSMLGKQSRASAFWRGYGGNPIVRHHAYLPGTHLVMLPAYLAARVGGVPFDARVVSLAALVAATLLAAGFFREDERRLAAAACVLLNPLVYWHQSFGANDMLFVAMLLGAARLLDAGRGLLGGALLGLACATKQLAWPFAPFLLLQARGATDLPSLLSPACRARLGGPVLAAAAVFAVVVAPVAALDLRGFYGDIVAYNLGLGEDRYPLGGTPGFGLANFVLSAGGVRTLRDASPVGAASLLLLPLLVLLARAQLRRPGVGAALAAGSVALLATLYVSRVPHASYLIAVAALLPVGALLGAASVDVAVVPLLLLLLGTTVVERGVFRLAWQDVAGTRPALTEDPLGLAVGATAAGLAVAYAAMLGSGPRARRALCLLALLSVVVAPTLIMVRLGRQGSMVRAQQAALVPVDSAREAWSTSFRSEPPARLPPEPSAAAALASTLSRAAGLHDARLAGLAGVVALLALPAPAWALLALTPPVALGTIFGSHVGLWCAAAVLVQSAARRTAGARVAAALLGLAALAEAGSRNAIELSAGVGLVNLAAYLGRQASLGVEVALALRPVAVAAVAAWTWRRARSPAEAFAGAALAWLVALFLAPAASPFALEVPLALAVLAVREG